MGCLSQKMEKITDSDHVLLSIAKPHYSETLEPQEVLCATFNSYGTNEKLVAIIYEKHDLVILCRESQNVDPEHYYLEGYCSMRIAGFFKFINTMPNPNRFAMHDQRFRDSGMHMGVRSLKELEQHE